MIWLKNGLVKIVILNFLVKSIRILFEIIRILINIIILIKIRILVNFTKSIV